MLKKIKISRSEKYYQAWPDVVKCKSGKLIVVFNECTHHGDRSHTQIMLTESFDGGRSWSESRPLSDSTDGCPYSYDCPRISQTGDGRLAAILNRGYRGKGEAAAEILVSFSKNEGKTWSKWKLLPIHGIVPDQWVETSTGRVLIAAHRPLDGKLTEYMIYSDDHGKTWSGEICIAHSPDFNLCEVSLLPLKDGKIVGFLRENSWKGYDCKKIVSLDNGNTWGPVTDFPLPACHRPVAEQLQDGTILITFRLMQGGRGWLGNWTQNFMGAFTDEESVLSEERNSAATRIFPLDFDRSPKSDLGYSGHVQLDNGEIFVVNYIVDDAIDKGQIRGYLFRKRDFLLPEPKK